MTVEQYKLWPTAWLLLGATLVVLALINGTGVVLPNAGGVDRSLNDTYYVVGHPLAATKALLVLCLTALAYFVLLNRRIVATALPLAHLILAAAGLFVAHFATRVFPLASVMPHKYEDYPAAFEQLNAASQWGWWIFVASYALFFLSVVTSRRKVT